MINVGIIEDNKFMMEGWSTFINFEKDMKVVTTHESVESALESDKMSDLDVLILDISLPGMSGIDGIKHIRDKNERVAIIMATIHDDDENIFNALKAGAIGYLMKKVTPDLFVQAIRDAFRGESPITPNIARKVIGTFHHSKIMAEFELTEREHQILMELSKGLSYSAIGREIFLSEDGVRHHVRNIYRKLQVNSKAEAVSKGIKIGLIQ
ncbi:MAG: response regulator transcription factor [Balneolales bacterium]|nr:response regulator transcription factor [Balneolales bacterium]